MIVFLSRVVAGSLAALAAFVVASERGATAEPSPSPVPAAIPTGVRIPVTLAETLTSGTARVGQTFSFTTDRAETLGTLAVPRGTTGTGRIAAVSRAVKGHNGSLLLQADALHSASDTAPIWVDMGGKPLSAHYAKKHVFPAIIPVPPFFIPTAYVDHTGDLIIDAGTHFSVTTSLSRPALSPLYNNATPDPALTPAASPGP